MAYHRQIAKVTAACLVELMDVVRCAMHGDSSQYGDMRAALMRTARGGEEAIIKVSNNEELSLILKGLL
jgi:hypothetical protein